MDNLKKYLQEHKAELDIDTPSGKVLQRIQAQTVSKKQVPVIKMVMRIAVAACLLALISIGYLFYPHSTKPAAPVAANPAPAKPLTAIPQATVSDTTENKTIAVVKPSLQKAASIKKRQPVQPDPESIMRSFENNYTQLVNLQLNSIRSTPVYADTKGYFTEFKTSLRQMDMDEAGVRANIKANGLNETLLQQLINIYQQKLDVLKSLQQEINKINNRVKQNQLPADTLTTHFINI